MDNLWTYIFTWLPTIGLILDAIGVLLLGYELIGGNRYAEIVERKKPTKTYLRENVRIDVYDDEGIFIAGIPLEDTIPSRDENFLVNLASSRKLAFAGVGFLLVGFILQIIGSWPI